MFTLIWAVQTKVSFETFVSKETCNLAKKCQLTTRVQALCAYPQPVPEGVSKKFWNLIIDMKEDEITP